MSLRNFDLRQVIDALYTHYRSILFYVALVLTLFCGWVALHYPNPRLAHCNFVWFGPAGFWDCPKGSGDG